MGFFSDLKEDLSQAVNELAPQEAAEASETTEKGDIDLNALLDSIAEEAVAAPQETPEVAPVEDRKPAPRYSDAVSIITEGMTVQGDVNTTGSLDLAGGIIGNVTVAGKLNIMGSIEGNSSALEVFADSARINGDVNSQGSIKIGRGTVIIGNIFATSAVVAGAVKGDIDVRGPVILDATAIVMGNIKSKSVQINNGAVIEGICSQCYAEVSPSVFFDDLKKKK